jgi:hypothetical protein
VAGAHAAPSGFDRARAVADAVLYEGYLLYPYRGSSPKNRVRWQFGVVLPRGWAEPRSDPRPTVAGSAESWFQQTECLAECSEDAAFHVRLRCLQLQRKQVERRTPGVGYQAVAALDAGGTTHLPFDEAVERELDVVVGVGDALSGGRAVRLGVPGGEDVEPLTGDMGSQVGRVVRRRWPLEVRLQVSARPADTPFRALRIQIRTENATAFQDPGASRHQALTRSLLAAHCFVGVSGGSFLSLLDPPAWAARAAATCENLHTFPVLVGEPGARDLILSSPIILYDYPEVAPESPGDLFDATEIDELLSLRTLTLTDEEKREARATDPRSAAIVDRVESMPPEMLARLHGAVRSLRPARSGSSPEGSETPPWWDPGADASVSPDTDSVEVNGVPVSRGRRVRLRPRGGRADAHDMFLAGRTARVEAVFLDVDDRRHVAVTVEDDPASELQQWHGRFFYFSPGEIEPIPEETAP